jgi:hypothetical protein
MRLEYIIATRKPELTGQSEITETSFNFCSKENLDKIFDWCFQQLEIAPPPAKEIFVDDFEF